jgi:hypothetical protein
MVQQERDSFVLVASSEDIATRIRQACEFLNVKMRYFSSVQGFLSEDRVRPRTLLIDIRDLVPEEASVLNRLRKQFPKTHITGIVDQTNPQLKDWGLKYVLTSELLKTFVLEFFLFQRNYCEFFEIQPTDLFPDTLVYFNAYHFLPLNQKFLPLVHENFILSEKKQKRIESLSQLYIYREDSSAYVQYIEKYFDQFKAGLRKRARSRVYQLLVEWRDLLYKYTFELSPIISGHQSSPDFVIWLNELNNYIMTSEDPWGLVSELCQLSCFDIDRSLLKLIIASFLSRNLGEDEAEQIVDLNLLLTLCRIHADSFLFKRWHLSQELTGTDALAWATYGDYLQNLNIAPDFPKPILEKFDDYKNQFLVKQNKDIKSSLLVYTYLGEVIVKQIRNFSTGTYKKDELIENVLVKIKKDEIIAEAWIEEIREFMKR